MGLEINQNRSVHEDWNNFKTKKKTLVFLGVLVYVFKMFRKMSP